MRPTAVLQFGTAQPSLTLSGLTLETRISGEGQPLVLIGGGLQGADSWGPLIPRLEANRKVIRLQNLNVEFGLKNRPLPEGYSVKAESAAARAALDKLALKQPIDLVGWSSGGAIALDFALDHPERIRSLTLIEPTAFWVLGPDERKDPGLVRMGDLMRRVKGEISDEQFEAFICGTDSSTCSGTASPRTLPIWSRLVRYRQALNGLSVYLVHTDEISRLNTFRKPVLIVTGSQSAKFAKDIDRRLGDSLASSRKVELSGGHASFLT